MDMVNKKGVVKIAEAIIAVLLVLGGLLIITSKTNFNSEKDFNYDAHQILKEIAANSSFREGILEERARIIEKLETFVNRRINTAVISFEIKICGLGDLCLLDAGITNQEEVYSAERVISSSRTCRDCAPKKVKIFLWRKF